MSYLLSMGGDQADARSDDPWRRGFGGRLVTSTPRRPPVDEDVVGLDDRVVPEDDEKAAVGGDVAAGAETRDDLVKAESGSWDDAHRGSIGG